MKSQITPTVYAAAHETAVYTDRSDLGMLLISGETRLDLIHRMSTQAVNGLPSGSGTATILTSEIGRMIDRMILYATSDSVYALTGENNADNIARYLMRFVFFNDDFKMTDMSEGTAVFGIYGPQATQILGEEVGFPEMDMELHHWRKAEFEGVSAYVHRTDPINGASYFVVCSTEDKEAILQILNNTSLIQADAAAFDFLRIEAGQPRFGREITTDYIPLEAKLWDDVSFTKGCYIGQEIIARMESRGRVAKQLVTLKSSGSVEVGAIIRSNGKKAGSITSTAVGPSGSVSLGYVRTAVLEAGGELMVGLDAASATVLAVG